MYQGFILAIHFTTTTLLNIVRFTEDFVMGRGSLNRGSIVIHELCDCYLYFYTETLKSMFSTVQARKLVFDALNVNVHLA